MNALAPQTRALASAALLFLSNLLPAAERSVVPDAKISTEGLALWLGAEGAVVENGEVTAIKDRSGKNNDSSREKDPKLAAGNPKVVKHEQAGQPVLRFDGRFAGYEFNSIKNARTVFFVVSKHPAAFKNFTKHCC